MRNELIYNYNNYPSFIEEVLVFLPLFLLSGCWACWRRVDETSDVGLRDWRVLEMVFYWTEVWFFAVFEVVAVSSVEVLNTLTGQYVFLLGVRRFNGWIRIGTKGRTVTNVRIYMLLFVAWIRSGSSGVELFKLSQNTVSSVLQLLYLLYTVYACKNAQVLVVSAHGIRVLILISLRICL